MKNRGLSDLVGYGVAIVEGQLQKDPLHYLEYGPYWWALKQILIKRGKAAGDYMDEKIADIYKGETDEETLTAAFIFSDYYTDNYLPGNRAYVLNPEDPEEYILFDPDYSRI